MGGVEHFRLLASQFRDVPLLASGGVGPENAPSFLELGALGAIVDQGVFPQPSEPAAAEVIRARAAALVEVCADAMGTPKRISVTEAMKPSNAPPGGATGPESHIDALLEGEGHDPFADGAAPLDLGMDEETVEVSEPPPQAAAAPPAPPPPPPPAATEDDAGEDDFEAFDNLDD